MMVRRVAASTAEVRIAAEGVANVRTSPPLFCRPIQFPVRSGSDRVPSSRAGVARDGRFVLGVGLSLRVCIADDHQLMLYGVRDALLQSRDITVVGLTHRGAEVVEMVAAQQPHLVRR